MAAFVVAGWVVGLANAQVGSDEPAPPESRDGEAAGSEWTSTDIKLANHYLGLLQRQPEYGSVLDLLWQLYEKRESTPLLLDYIGGAAAGDEEGTAKLLHAHLLRKNGDSEAAADAYGAALELQPENIHALRGAAEIAEADEKTAKALSYYNRLIPLLPLPDRTGAEMRMRKAALVERQGDVDTAVKIWMEVLGAFPDDLGLRSQVVGLLFEANRVENAVGVLRELTRSHDPELKVSALRKLNQLFELTADFDGAAEVAREGLELAHYKHHVYADFFARLVRLHERFGRLAELEAELIGAAESESPTTQAVHDVVEFFRLTANPRERERWLEQLVELAPGNPAYRVELAHTQIENDHYEAAAATVDGLIAEGASSESGAETAPLPLLLLRARIEISLSGKDAAAASLQHYVDEGRPTPEALRKVLAFGREHYLDDLVESLLRGPLGAVEFAGKDDVPPAVRLAGFLRERGRLKQARETLQDFVDEAGDDLRRRGRRLEQAAAAFREMELLPDALAAIENAIELSPERLDLEIQKAEILVAQQAVDAAVAAFEEVWQRTEGIDAKTEIDQRLFSLLRGLGGESDANASGSGGAGALPAPPPLGSSPAAMAEYRRKKAEAMAAIAQATAASGMGFAAEAAPPELLAFYQRIKGAAKVDPSVENRYRVAWWAFRQQDHQEMYHQLAGLHDPTHPVIEAEQLMLELAEQTENTLLMARQLELLARIDLDNQTEYRQRWAEVRFKLGYEDEAVRLLQELARDPDASLSTLKSLAAVYQAQGRKQDQVEVWRRAYARGNVFEKRQIIKQLTSTLLELGEPSEALDAQMDLISRETDLVQKRKHFDAQLSLANRQYLLGELLDRYRELAQQSPFERFYPEALARIHRTMGNHDAAFEAMKKAYYMSGEDRELLAELGEMAGETSDIKAAIYYRRQLIATNDEGTDVEGWKALIGMLERDLRVVEADRIRARLEGKFAQDADFLKSLGGYYQEIGRRDAALRVLEELVRLRSWDASALLELGLLRREAGDLRGAYEAFEKVIIETAEAALSPAERNFEYLPIIDGGWFSGVGTRPTSGGLADLVSGMQGYAYLTLELQDELSSRFRRPHPEFHRVPRGDSFIRLRAIEEASRMVAAGVSFINPDAESADRDRAPTATDIEDARDAWVRRWDRPGEFSPTERLWALYHVGDHLSAHRLLRETMLPATLAADQFSYLMLSLRMNRPTAVVDWLNSPDRKFDPDFDDAATLPLLAVFLLLQEGDERLSDQAVETVLAELTINPEVIGHLIDRLVHAGQLRGAYLLARARVQRHPDSASEYDCFLAAHLAQGLGHEDERREWLERAVAATTLRPVRGRPFDAGWMVPPSFFQIAAELLSLTPDAAAREQLQRRLVDRVESHPGVTEELRLEAKVLLAYASGDGIAGTAALRRLMERHANGSRPLEWDTSGLDTRLREFWMMSERIVNQMAQALPADASRRDFHAAFEPLEQSMSSGDLNADEQYEQFEVARFCWSIEDMSRPERQVALRLFADRLRGENSVLELVHTLESRSFFADVVPLYLQLLEEDPEDFTLVRGLFQACRESGDSDTALRLVNRFLDRELPRSAGMTDAYLVGEHAYFLELARDVDALTAFAQSHPFENRTAEDEHDAEIDGGRPGGRARDALFDRVGMPALDWSVEYQRALARVHQARGDHEAALRVYHHLRQMGVLELASRVSAVDLLIEKGEHELARSWLAGVAFDRVQPGDEAEALRRLVQLNARPDQRDVERLAELARTALDLGDLELVEDVATSLFSAGLRAEADSLLLLRSRQAKDSAGRHGLLLRQIELRYGVEGEAGADAGEAEPRFSEVEPAVAALAQGLSPAEPAALRWLELIESCAARDPEGWRDGLERIAGSGKLSNDRALLDLARYLVARLAATGDPAAISEAESMLNPGAWSLDGVGLAVLVLAVDPDPVSGTDRPSVSSAMMERLRDRLLAEAPSAPQAYDTVQGLARHIEVLARAGLDEPLGDLHRQLMLETVGGGMQRRSSVDGLATFELRWQLPRVFVDSGRADLAAPLYRAYLASIARLTRSHTAFVEDCARFLMDGGEWLAAENLLRRLFLKSLGGDPQLLVALDRSHDERLGAEPGDLAARFYLSPGDRREVHRLIAEERAGRDGDNRTPEPEEDAP